MFLEGTSHHMQEGKTRSKASTEEVKERHSSRGREREETATLAKESDPTDEVMSQLTGGIMTVPSGAIEEDQRDDQTKKAEQKEKRIKMLKQQVVKLSQQVMAMKNSGGENGENGDSKYVSDMMAKMKEHIRRYEDKLHLAEKFSSELKASNVKLSKMVRQREDDLKAQAIKFKAQGERNDELVEQNQALLKKV